MDLPAINPAGGVNLVAGATMVALAVWLMVLDVSSRLHRAFSVFLVLRGAMNVVEAFPFVDGIESFPLRLHAWFDMAVAFAALHFGLAFRARYGLPQGRRYPAWAGAALLAGLVVSGGLYAWRPDLYFGESRAAPGPLALFGPLRNLGYALIAWVVVGDALRQGAGPRRSAGLLTGAAFLLTPAYIGAGSVLAALGPRAVFERPEFFVIGMDFASPVALLGSLLLFSAFALALAIVVRSSTASAPEDAHRVARLVGAAAALGLVVASVAFLDVTLAGNLLTVFDGVTTLALPLLVSYAILRHRLFDLDVKIKWTLSRGTLAAAFVAVFFVVSEAAATMFQGWTGSAGLGIVAAGLLVFAIAPLQRMAERVADAAMPGVRRVSDLQEGERLTLYREQVRAAWEDGALSRDERRLLEVARERLGIAPDVAAAIEREVLAAPAA